MKGKREVILDEQDNVEAICLSAACTKCKTKQDLWSDEAWCCLNCGSYWMLVEVFDKDKDG
jgi:hypothetical protein